MINMLDQQLNTQSKPHHAVAWAFALALDLAFVFALALGTCASGFSGSAELALPLLLFLKSAKRSLGSTEQQPWESWSWHPGELREIDLSNLKFCSTKPTHHATSWDEIQPRNFCRDSIAMRSAHLTC